MTKHPTTLFRRSCLVLGLGLLWTAAGCESSPTDSDDSECEAPPALSCTSCHGSGDDPAPPRDTDDGSSTDLVTVGAHQAHLSDGTLRQGIACGECHVVPGSVADEAHIDGGPAELVFGELARLGSPGPAWDRESATCADTYCHGSTLSGGSNTTPVWTTVDGSQAACGTCHGAPPPGPLHPQSGDCATCHPATVLADGSIDVAGGHHINGLVEVEPPACNACHGGADNAAPPADTQGGTTTDLVTVGAHQAHLRDGTFSQALACQDCHLVPVTVGALGHIDGGPAELTWGTLATTDDASPQWDRNSATCADTYCHGATLGGGTNTAPLWTTVNGSQAVCGSCHGLPPPPPHPANGACELCHSQTMAGPGTIDVAGGFHIDGWVQ